jgi:hypothetical protein
MGGQQQPSICKLNLTKEKSSLQVHKRLSLKENTSIHLVVHEEMQGRKSMNGFDRLLKKIGKA